MIQDVDVGGSTQHTCIHTQTHVHNTETHAQHTQTHIHRDTQTSNLYLDKIIRKNFGFLPWTLIAPSLSFGALIMDYKLYKYLYDFLIIFPFPH